MDDLAGHFQLWEFCDSLTHLKPFPLFAKQTQINLACKMLWNQKTTLRWKYFQQVSAWTTGIWIVQDYGEKEFLKKYFAHSSNAAVLEILSRAKLLKHGISSSFLLCWSFLLSYAEHCSCNFFSIISELILLCRGSKLEQTTNTTWV